MTRFQKIRFGRGVRWISTQINQRHEKRLWQPAHSNGPLCNPNVCSVVWQWCHRSEFSYCRHHACGKLTTSLTWFPKLHALRNFIYRRRISDMYNEKVSLSYNVFLVHIVTWHCSIFVIFLQYLLHCKCCNYVIRNKAEIYYYYTRKKQTAIMTHLKYIECLLL